MQNVVFSFEKGSDGQNYSSSDSHHPKKSPKQNFLLPPRGEIPPTPQRYLENPAIEFCFTHQFIEGVIQVVALITFFNQCMSTVNYFFGFDKTAI